MSRHSQVIRPRRQLPTRPQAAGTAICTTQALGQQIGIQATVDQQFASQIHEVVESQDSDTCLRVVIDPEKET
eukprot:12933524-Prorocentrum_lima.AAC.1